MTTTTPVKDIHLTVAAVIERNGKMLLVTDDTHQGYKLNQPAGHIQDGESIIEAVIRETKEECGLDFHPQKVIGVYLYKLFDTRTYLRICFKGIVSGDLDNPQPSPTDDGVISATWYSLEELKNLKPSFRSQLVEKCIEDYLSGQEFDLSLIAPYQAQSNYDKN